MGPNQGVADWVQNRAQQVADALASGTWSLKPSGHTKTLQSPCSKGLLITKRTLDFAIGGAGYFLFVTPDGIAGSREGRLTRSDTGHLLNSHGHKLDIDFAMPANATNLVVLRTGEMITQSVDGSYEAAGLLRLGTLTDDGWKRGEPCTAGFGPILQGALDMDSQPQPHTGGLINRHAYRQPAAGASLAYFSTETRVKKTVSSQQVAVLMARMLAERESIEEPTQSSKDVVEVLVRLAVNRLTTKQASELRRSLRLTHLEDSNI